MGLAEIKVSKTYYVVCPDHPYDAYSTHDPEKAEAACLAHNTNLHPETERLNA